MISYVCTFMCRCQIHIYAERQKEERSESVSQSVMCVTAVGAAEHRTPAHRTPHTAHPHCVVADKRMFLKIYLLYILYTI